VAEYDSYGRTAGFAREVGPASGPLARAVLGRCGY
jgi:hypothetical protein